MARFQVRFVLVALAIGWAVDLLFFKQPLGLNFLLWVLLVLAGGIFLVVSEKKKLAWQSWILAAVVLAAGALPFLRMDGITRVAGVLLALAGLIFLADTALTGSWLLYRIVDWVSMVFRLIGAAFSRPPELFKPAEGEEPSSRLTFKSTLKLLGRILLGLMLALPVVLVLGSLLSSADQIFSDQIAQLLENLRLEKIVEYGMRLVYVAVLAYLFAGLLLHTARPRGAASRADPQRAAIKPFLGFLETNIILGAVLVLFLAFVMVQFRYLFGGETHLQAMGLTYSEYAVSGFEELVMVAVLSLGLYLVLATIGKRETPGKMRTFTLLTALLLVLVLVILASSWMRLRLYENAYGFTQLRTYTHFFIPWLGALLLATLGLEIIRRRGHFAVALVAAAIGFGLTLGLVNVQGFIVRQNIARAEAGKPLDMDYLTQLSWDAVPVLYDEYLKLTPGSEAYDKVSLSLSCFAAELPDQPTHDWRGTTFSEIQARKILQDPQKHQIWNRYPTRWNETDRVYEIITDSEVIPCSMFEFWD